MTTLRYRAADLFKQLDRNSRPDLNLWLGYLQTFSLGSVEGTGMTATLDRAAAEYEIRAYCSSPESKEAAFAWLDGFEVVSDADLAYIEEVAAGIDRALAQDAALWEAQDEALMTEAGVTATQLDAQRLEASPEVTAGFMQGFTNVRVLDVDHDLLRMDGEDVQELLQRLQAFGSAKVQVMVHRHLGCSVVVWVGALGEDGKVAGELLAEVQSEWERLQRYEQAVAAYGEGKEA